MSTPNPRHGYGLCDLCGRQLRNIEHKKDVARLRDTFDSLVEQFQRLNGGSGVPGNVHKVFKQLRKLIDLTI